MAPRDDARNLARTQLSAGSVLFSAHVRKRMQERDIQAGDIENALRAGTFCEWTDQSGASGWQASTGRIVVCLKFINNDTKIVITTAWRP